jgi:hypothetical protein
MCFKKYKIEDDMEYSMDCTQHNGIYKRNLEQWIEKHNLSIYARHITIQNSINTRST